ncbi:translationally-controlled tumor protein [Kitasatospora sp. NPDC015120]|uniref:translationally-controlled tumor protein n=1 Tax=Kitasatospora sp. NPDC015120 TaxID=3364023 RepID=UPI0036F46A7C
MKIEIRRRAGFLGAGGCRGARRTGVSPTRPGEAAMAQEKPMKLYKDVFSGDELLSDTFPIKEDGVCYVVEGQYIDRPHNTVDIGAAAEEEDTESTYRRVLNVVDRHRLVAASYDKKTYTGHIRAYVKRLSEKVPADERATWQQQANEWAKTVLADFDSYQCYTGESNDPEAMVVLMKFSEDGKTPFLYYIRHGLKTEAF